MAYTKTPMSSTDQTTNLSLMNVWNSRNGANTIDADNLNVLFEPVVSQLTGDKYFEVLKREGHAVWATGAGPLRYSFDWNAANQYVVVVANTLYTFDKNTGLQLGTFVMNAANAANQLGFAEYQYANGAQALIVVGSQFNYVITQAGVITAITLPGGVLGVIPYPAVLDGYLFLAQSNGIIWNSKNNDPTDFSNNEFIAAEDYPDGMEAMSRMGPYIVAFGKNSIQFFYDNANEVGTPLNKHATTLRYGFSGGLSQYADTLLFIGFSVGGDISAFQLDGFKVTDIGSATFSRWYATRRPVVQSGFTYLARWRGSVVAYNGHPVYIPTLFYEVRPSSGDPAPLQPFDVSYGVDLSSGLWTRLSFGATTLFPVSGYGDSLITFVGDSNIYKVTRNIGTDNLVNYDVLFCTPTQDFGTHRMKFGTRLVLWADQTPAASYTMLSWSKDDYQTFTTPRAVDMSHQYQQLYAMGSFRKLAIKATYNASYPMRWKLMEMDYQVGQA